MKEEKNEMPVAEKMKSVEERIEEEREKYAC